MNKHRATREPINWKPWRQYALRTIAIALIKLTTKTKTKHNNKKQNKKK